MSSLIDKINADAKKKADEQKKKHQQQQEDFKRKVEQRQKQIGQGEYGKGGSKDVRARSITDAEAKEEAKKRVRQERPKTSISVGQRKRDGSRVLSASGSRAPEPTDAEISKHIDASRKTVELKKKHPESFDRRGNYTGFVKGQNNSPQFVAHRRLEYEAAQKGYDINRSKVTTTVKETEGRPGEFAEFTTVKAKYTPDGKTQERQRKEAEESRDAAVKAKIAEIKAIPGFSGYSVSYDKDGTANISYTVGAINQSASISTPTQSAGQTEEEFLAEQKAKGLRFTGEKTTDPVTGETSYQFEDLKARDAALREQNTRIKVLKANASYIGYKAEEEYNEQGEITGINFEPRKGRSQFTVLNAQGADVTSEFLRGEISEREYSQLSFEENPNPEKFNPNIGEQLHRSTVGYGGNLLASVIDLAGEGQVRLYEFATGDKIGAQQARERGQKTTAGIREATSLTALGKFYGDIGNLTGSPQYKEASKHALEQAKHDTKPAVGLIEVGGGAIASAFGSKEGKEVVDTFVEQSQKRPLETSITGAIDVLSFVGTGGASAVAKEGVTASKIVGGAVAKGSKGAVSASRSGAIGFRIEKGTKVATSKDVIEPVPYKSSAPIKFENITVDLGKGTAKAPDSGYGYGGGKGKTTKPKGPDDPYGGSGATKKVEGGTYEYSTKEGTLLLEREVSASDDVLKTIDDADTKTIQKADDVTEGYTPPEEQIIPDEGIIPPEETAFSGGGGGSSAPVTRPKTELELKKEAKQARKEQIKLEQVARRERQEKIRKENIARDFINFGGGQVNGRSLFLQQVRNLGKGKLKGKQRTGQLQERQVILETVQRLGKKTKTTFKQEKVGAFGPRTTTVQTPKQVQKVEQVPIRTTKQKQKTAVIRITDEGQVPILDEPLRFTQGFKFGERTTTRTRTDTVKVPRPIPDDPITPRIRMPPILPRGGGGGGSSRDRYGSSGGTAIDENAIANILFPTFSLRGKGEQDKGAKRLLDLTLEDTGKLDILDAKPLTKEDTKGKGKKTKSILDIF